MPSETELVILPDSDEAARPVTVTGWQSRIGRFYFDERTARYDGSTHNKCVDCGQVCRHGHTTCDVCTAIRRFKDWEKKWRESDYLIWDGNEPVFSEAWEKYFFSETALSDYIEENEGFDVREARLYLCIPNYARDLATDYFCDEMPEDDDYLPNELADAIAAFNAALTTYGKPLSYAPDYKRAVGVNVLADRDAPATEATDVE